MGTRPRRSPHRRRGYCRSIGVLGTLLATGCSTPGGQSQECVSNADCASSHHCVDGMCTPRPSDRPPPAITFDAGKRDAGKPDVGPPPDAGTCGPAVCDVRMADCGDVIDDCQTTVPCGTCETGLECVDNMCVCMPKECPSDGSVCGSIDDGCGGTIECSECSPGKYCDTNHSCVCYPSLQEQTWGQREHTASSRDWDEFENPIPSPIFRLGTDDPGTLRPWIGHSECSICAPGSAKKQRLAFSQLVPGDVYRLHVYPAWVRGTAYYSALVTEGSADILSGVRKDFAETAGFLSPADQWVVAFRANTPEVTIDLGHGISTGSHYIYIDAYEFKPDTPCR